jgi:arylsulfatase A-like enzyme
MGPRGDVIAELDWTVGQILDALDRNGLTTNTMVIFTSDNGPVVDDGYRDDAVAKLGNHRPAGPYRGGKYRNFEGGTRVPLIVRWPGHINPGISNALISQVDFLATFATLTGAKAPGNAALDSNALLPVLLGQSQTGRQYLIEQASALSLREGVWKYIPPSEGPAVVANVGIETGNSPEPQLYDLAADPGERRNLASANPDRVRTMSGMLDRIRKAPL